MSNEFGKYMKEKRLAMGKTLREFCTENALDSVYISRLERGIEPPPEYHDLNRLHRLLQLNWYEWEEFKRLAEKGNKEYVKPYIAKVSMTDTGMIFAYDAEGNQVEVCNGFILAVAGKLIEHCDENTKWTFGQWLDRKLPIVMGWWWREGHAAKSQNQT